MVLKINGNSLLKVINTVFNEGILRIISYYDSDYHTASLKEKRMHISYLRQQMVRTERLELSHLAALEPKSSVSTNFTTSA